jgi:hypothetical protein
VRARQVGKSIFEMVNARRVEDCGRGGCGNKASFAPFDSAYGRPFETPQIVIVKTTTVNNHSEALQAAINLAQS